MKGYFAICAVFISETRTSKSKCHFHTLPWLLHVSSKLLTSFHFHTSPHFKSYWSAHTNPHASHLVSSTRTIFPQLTPIGSFCFQHRGCTLRRERGYSGGRGGAIFFHAIASLTSETQYNNSKTRHFRPKHFFWRWQTTLLTIRKDANHRRTPKIEQIK